MEEHTKLLYDKRRKERKVAEMLRNKYKRPYNLKEHDGEPKDVPYNEVRFMFLPSTDHTRSKVLFLGDGCAQMRNRARLFFAQQNHTADKDTDPSGPVMILNLKKIAAVSKEQYAEFMEEKERRTNPSPQQPKTATVSKPEKYPPNPMDRIRINEKLAEALRAIESFHRTQMLLGTKRRSSLVASEKGGVIVEYFYASDTELVHAAERSGLLLGHEPELLDRCTEEERFVLRYELEHIVVPKEQIPIDDRQFLPAEAFHAAEFILSTFLKLRFEHHESPGRGYASFRFVDAQIDIGSISRELTRYGVRNLVHEDRKLKLYVAITEVGEKAFRQHRKPSEILANLEGTDRRYDKSEGLQLVRSALEKSLNWKLPRDYQYHSSCPNEEEGLEYVSVLPKHEGGREEIKKAYQKILAELPAGVSASFEGIKVKNGKSFFIYFRDREKVLERVRILESRPRIPRSTATLPVLDAPKEVLQQTEQPLLNGSRDRHFIKLMVEMLPPSERQTLASFLGIKDNSEAAVEAYKREVAQRFAGCRIINENDERAKQIIATYHPDIFKDPGHLLDQ